MTPRHTAPGTNGPSNFAPNQVPNSCEQVMARPRLHPFRADAHVEVVHLAVAFRRREAKQILTVQLVGDTFERSPEILPEPDFRVAGASLFRNDCEAGVR